MDHANPVRDRHSMIIGVVSDTHGEISNLRMAFRRAVQESGAEVFIHLGDDYDDMKAVEAGNTEIIRVPGIFSDYYSRDEVENRVIRELGEWRFLLSHTSDADSKDLEGDMDPRKIAESNRVDVLLHGHTHIPEIALEKGYIRINPGNLRDKDKKGYPPTFCIIDAGPDSLDVKIFQLYAEEEFLARKFNREMLRR